MQSLKAKLTPRENEILKLRSDGYDIDQTASLLFISPRTVEKHMTNIIGKTGIRNLADTIKHAMRTGVIRDPEGWARDTEPGFKKREGAQGCLRQTGRPL